MTPDESDEVRAARELRDQASQEEKAARGRWLAIWPVLRENELMLRKNHFADLFRAAFEGRRGV